MQCTPEIPPKATSSRITAVPLDRLNKHTGCHHAAAEAAAVTLTATPAAQARPFLCMLQSEVAIAVTQGQPRSHHSAKASAGRPTSYSAVWQHHCHEPCKPCLQGLCAAPGLVFSASQALQSSTAHEPCTTLRSAVSTQERHQTVKAEPAASKGADRQTLSPNFTLKHAGLDTHQPRQ